MSHEARVKTIVAEFGEAMSRFQARIADVPADKAEASEPGRWSLAQLAWHVALVNEAFAKVIDGTFAGASAPVDGFTERPWQELGAQVPSKAQAPERVRPPDHVAMQDARARLDASRDLLVSALEGLTPERAMHVHQSKMLGPISLYQVGEWATHHVIRHNRQAKQTLEPQI